MSTTFIMSRNLIVISSLIKIYKPNLNKMGRRSITSQSSAIKIRLTKSLTKTIKSFTSMLNRTVTFKLRILKF